MEKKSGGSGDDIFPKFHGAKMGLNKQKEYDFYHIVHNKSPCGQLRKYSTGHSRLI